LPPPDNSDETAQPGRQAGMVRTDIVVARHFVVRSVHVSGI
jgi:hypothetical protein